MLDNPYFGKLVFPRPLCGWGHCSGPGRLAFHFLPTLHLDNPCPCVQSGLEVTGPFPAQNSSLHLLFRGTCSKLTDLALEVLQLVWPHPIPPPWWALIFGNRPAQGYLGSQLLPSGTQLCVQATSVQTALCHWQCWCPTRTSSLPLSGPQASQGDTGLTPPQGALAGVGRGLEHPGSRTTRHWISLSSCPFPSPSDDSGFKSVSSVRRSQDGALIQGVCSSVQGHLKSQHRMLSLASGLRFWDLQALAGRGGRWKTRGPWGEAWGTADTQ